MKLEGQKWVFILWKKREWRNVQMTGGRQALFASWQNANCRNTVPGIWGFPRRLRWRWHFSWIFTQISMFRWSFLPPSSRYYTLLGFKPLMEPIGAFETSAPTQSYPPYLAPADFFLFPKLKSSLKGRRFQTVEEIEENWIRDLRAIPQNTFQEAFQNWKKYWARCIKSGGKCFEGDKFKL